MITYYYLLGCVSNGETIEETLVNVELSRALLATGEEPARSLFQWGC